MTATTERRRTGATRGVTLAAFALLALCLPGAASAQWAPSSNGAANISNTNTGNVGIGTTAPVDKLHVEGRARGGDFLSVGNGGHQSWKDALASRAANFGLSVPGQPATDNIQLSTYAAATWTSRMTILNSNGNVGIGTMAPIFKLSVGNSTQQDGRMLIEGADNNSSILFNTGGLNRGRVTTLANGLHLQSYSGAWVRNDLFVRDDGNVGVGTTAPAARLHVAGDIRVDGNINAKYQDVAEWVPSKQKLAAGTVVVLDTRHSNHVAASAVAYDTRVAGVISAQPGISLGEAGEGKVLVATTGRVKVRVDATKAAIQIGDLIVTGEAEGVGMKSEPIQLGGRQIHAPGTIIGKALEPLQKGVGEILVLLSLQ